MFNLFKRKKEKNLETGAKITPNCEDPSALYVDFPDGLRLIFRDEKYVGWYLPGEKED
jgi:hypothetical protein